MTASIPAAPLNPASDPAAEGPPSLEQLRDLQLPDPIGLWPPAPGWWVLALIASLALAWLGWKLINHVRHNRYRSYALQELLVLDRSEPQRALQNLNQLLRRTVLCAYPQQPVASLHGQAWLDFLYHSSQLEGFQQPLGQTLVEGPYRPSTDIDIEPLIALARLWIKRHRRGFLSPGEEPSAPIGKSRAQTRSSAAASISPSASSLPPANSENKPC